MAPIIHHCTCIFFGRAAPDRAGARPYQAATASANQITCTRGRISTFDVIEYAMVSKFFRAHLLAVAWASQGFRQLA